MLALVVAALLAPVSPSPAAASPNVADCAARLARAVEHDAAGGVPAACWRIGPVMLGMGEEAVEQRIGMPVAEIDAGSHYHAALYGFPTGTRSTPRITTQFRLVELRYVGGRLVAIDTAPGYRTDSERCAGHPGRVRAGDFVGDAPVGPLLAFDGVSVGDPTSVLARRFGRPAAANRSHDWYSYLPVPVSFDVDPDRSRIVGMRIATDDDALTVSALPVVHLGRDPASCRVTTVHYSLAKQ